MAGKHGVAASVQVLELGSELICDAYDLVKSKDLFGKLPKVLEVLKALTLVAKSAPEALPELQELDSEDVAKLSGAAFSAVKKIVEKLKV